MAYAPFTVAKGGIVTNTPTRNRLGFFRRFFNALMVARQRQVEREIARYLHTHRFSDETEREIERRFCPRRPIFEGGRNNVDFGYPSVDVGAACRPDPSRCPAQCTG